MEITEIINRIKLLNLSTYPKSDVLELMYDVGKICDIVVHFYEGTPILRGRPNKPNERFEKKSDYSFKPQCCNNTYQRASTPENSMFYGVVPNIKDIFKITEDEIKGMRVTTFCELFHSGFNINETPKISFGRWRVKEKQQLNVLAIIQKESYIDNNSLLQELNIAYNSFLEKNIDENLKLKSMQYSTFLANEFSKSIILKDFDYLISAVFSEIIAKHNLFDGILYPSVRADGLFFNIALSPDVVDSKLELSDVAECPIISTDNGFKVLKSDFNCSNVLNSEYFKLSNKSS